MAQHDYNLSNNTGALFRQDLNALANAIATVNSGASAPGVTFPGMLWLDLSGGGDGVMRRRNQANSAWLTDIGIDQVARDAAAAAQTTANAAMPKAGGTFTGPINLPGTVPTNNQALSRAQADALYQVLLPTTPATAGAMLFRSAAGWDQVLAPAANGTLLALSGGLPVWQTPTTVAAPNSIVRTGADGFIDPTLIPSVASGLRFRGTFRPAVNAEYPTTGGSGTGGAPAVGDFWVIDGLTTGGYTYLTGSLAGVTVYNGDSIARSDTSWYRMGSSVQLDGYMRTDGSTAMAGNLNMAAHNLIEVGGIAARAGTPVPLNNFSIDASNVVISPQRGTTGADLAVMTAGRIGTDMGRMQLFVGAGGSNVGLIPVRFFSATAAYAANDYVVDPGTGRQYRAKAAVAAGAFTPSQWAAVLDTAGGTFAGGLTAAYGTGYGWNSSTNAIGFSAYVKSTNGRLTLSVHDDTGVTLTDAFSIDRTFGTIYSNGQVINVANIGATVIGASGDSKWRTASSSGYTYLDHTDAGQNVYAQARLRAWGFSITVGPGHFDVGGGNITTNYTVVGNAGGDGSVAAFQVGNDCFLWDVNRADTCQFRGAANPATARIELGNTGNFGIGVSAGALNFWSPDYFAWYATGNSYMCHTSPHIAQYKKTGSYSWYWRRSANGFPGGGGDFNQMELNDAGALFVTGAVTASNIPGSDARLKSNIQPASPRAFDALPYHSFDFIDGFKDRRGVIAQEVLDFAPQHVIEYGVVVDGEWTTRYTVDYGGLALEAALNALARIAALEAVVNPPPETER